jgi:DNA-binding response OmpR family regulator
MNRNLRILVVDDDAPTRRLLAAALMNDRLYEIVTARHGAEALALFCQEPSFDLVLTDLRMPEMPGTEVVKRIRALDAHVPILVFTAVQTDLGVSQALEYGADDYLLKPVDLRELRRAVSFLVEQRKTALARAAAEESTATDVGPMLLPAFQSQADGTFVELTIGSDPEQIKRIQKFADGLVSATLDEKGRRELHLALDEVLSNAVEWGNRGDPQKKLRFAYRVLPDRVTFRVEDEGEGFNPDNIPNVSTNTARQLEERKKAGKRIGGWGILLTKSVMDEVAFNRKGNVVFLTKYLRPGGLTAMLSNSKPEKTAKTDSMQRHRRTRMLRKTTRLLRKNDPNFGAASSSSSADDSSASSMLK